MSLFPLNLIFDRPFMPPVSASTLIAVVICSTPETAPETLLFWSFAFMESRIAHPARPHFFRLPLVRYRLRGERGSYICCWLFTCSLICLFARSHIWFLVYPCCCFSSRLLVHIARFVQICSGSSLCFVCCVWLLGVRICSNTSKLQQSSCKYDAERRCWALWVANCANDSFRTRGTARGNRHWEGFWQTEIVQIICLGSPWGSKVIQIPTSCF